MLDSTDSLDGKSYLYTSFLMDNNPQLVKVLQAVPDRTNEFPELKYHFSIVNQPDNFDGTIGDEQAKFVP